MMRCVARPEKVEKAARGGLTDNRFRGVVRKNRTSDSIQAVGDLNWVGAHTDRQTESRLVEKMLGK